MIEHEQRQCCCNTASQIIQKGHVFIALFSLASNALEERIIIHHSVDHSPC